MLGFSVAQFSALLKVSSVTYRKIERGPVVLKPKQKEVLQHVGINPQYIEYGDVGPFSVTADKVFLNIVDAISKNCKEEVIEVR